MRWTPLLLAALPLAMSLAVACSDEASTPASTPVTKPPPAQVPAGDEPWVRQAVEVILGRKPRGIREVRVLVDLVKATDRATVARGLMNSPEFEPRWVDWLMDELQINRVGVKPNQDCWEAPLQPEDSGDVAAFVRDHGPDEPSAVGDFNMADVVRSSLRLDDLSPLYLANLFPMMARPIFYCKNLDDVENDLERRRNFGDIFTSSYIHRNIECLSCHNSELSVTFDPDPAQNRFWAIPGLFERALYGDSMGAPASEAFAVFRSLGVVDPQSFNGAPPPATSVRAWGLVGACGTFTPKPSIADDPAMVQARFAGITGERASVWDLQSSLRLGFDELRKSGLVVDPSTREVSPASALAYLTTVRMAHQVWQEAFGAPLTVAHNFPRNEAQRDILEGLAGDLVASHWSLRDLLLHIVQDPLFNLATPSGDGSDAAYGLPAVFYPWSAYDVDSSARGNGVGDQVHRAGARLMMRSIASALEWKDAPAFPDELEAQFQNSIGTFVSDGQPGTADLDFQGLLSWENRYGACEQPLPGIKHDEPTPDAPKASCHGRCDTAAFGGDGCSCDSACDVIGDCCSDFAVECTADPGAVRAPDWIDSLATEVASQAGTPVRVGDVASALKDRLLAEPDIDPVHEAPLIASLFDVATLDTPITDVDDWTSRARFFCGVLVKSPQFLMRGVPRPVQQSMPSLVVGASSYRDECERLGSLVIDAKAGTVVCDDASLTFQPATR